MPFKIAVIGAVNIDICGKPSEKYVPGDSNPGQISHSIGGVGFNIARNLAMLGCEVHFIAALGDDRYLEEIRQEARRFSICTENSLFVGSRPNSTYLFITDENGDMVSAVNDMAINALIDAAFLSGKLAFLNTVDAVIIDTNLSEEALSFLCRNVTVPIFADAVSAHKTVKIQPVLGFLTMFKPNRMEAERLTGIKITDINTARTAADRLIASGLKTVFLTLGADGVLAANGEQSIHHKPLCGKIVNTSGAGDAFFALAVYGTLAGLSLEETAVLGLKGADMACRTAGSLNQEIQSVLLGGQKHE